MKHRVQYAMACLLSGLFFSVIGATDSYYEHSIVVVICSYNNKNYYQKNLDSVYSQQYSNYRVLYVDDCSQDGTGELVETYVKEHNQEFRTAIIHNQKRLGAMHNFFDAIYSCDDNEIIVVLDGDDWFAQPQTLARINKEYVENDAWITYGQYSSYPDGMMGICQPIPEWVFQEQKIRTYPWVTSHVRTFYAWLFKSVKEDDFKHEGEFYSVTCDQAMMLPMLEMAGFAHQRFIPDILYIYNNETPLSDTRNALAQQIFIKNIIRSKLPYLQQKSPLIKGGNIRTTISHEYSIEHQTLHQDLINSIEALI